MFRDDVHESEIRMFAMLYIRLRILDPCIPGADDLGIQFRDDYFRIRRGKQRFKVVVVNIWAAPDRLIKRALTLDYRLLKFEEKLQIVDIGLSDDDLVHL